MFNKMKAEELKTYLCSRGLKPAGKKAILVVGAFSTPENNVAVIKTAEVEADLKQEYDDKLKLSEMNIQDSFKIKINNEWLDEEKGIAYWPIAPTYRIIQFLMIDKNAEDLIDYKGSKAHSDFTQGWLSNISYQNLGPSKYCSLKSGCDPSKRLRKSPHKLWVRLSKKKGKVEIAHCTCMAGMSSTSNHVAAALFRVEAAMRLGLTNSACTTKSCEWLQNRKGIQPV